MAIPVNLRTILKFCMTSVIFEGIREKRKRNKASPVINHRLQVPSQKKEDITSLLNTCWKGDFGWREALHSQLEGHKHLPHVDVRNYKHFQHVGVCVV